MTNVDPTQYRIAWQYHIEQLGKLALAANVTFDDFCAVKRRCEEWLETAVHQLEEEGADRE